jgi:hypothetical protein
LFSAIPSDYAKNIFHQSNLIHNGMVEAAERRAQMKARDFKHKLSVVTGIALLAGCGGSQPPISTPSGSSNSAAHNDSSLLYVSDEQAGEVYIVALPSGKLVGKLTGLDFPTGDCVDQQGNVFVDDSVAGEVRVYAHGAKSAFRVLNDSSWEPFGCSVDPTTGNLAVCNFRTKAYGDSIAIYLNAKGAAHDYEYSTVWDFSYCAYDGNGNLFADAFDYYTHNPMFLELPKGGSSLESVSLNPPITGYVAPPLLWDGKDLAISATSSGLIYRYRVRGSSGTRVGMVKLDDASEVAGPFWIASDGSSRTLYAPIVDNNIASLGIYRYPVGGKRLQNFYDAPAPFAVTVSASK